jgi:hypothetical protein
VEQSIKSKLASDPKMADTKIDVSADTGKNQVTLSGTVYSEAARTEAVNFAKDAKLGVEARRPRRTWLSPRSHDRRRSGGRLDLLHGTGGGNCFGGIGEHNLSSWSR